MCDHNIFTFFIALLFDLAAPNLQTTVLCLTSNVSINSWSSFLALVFFIDMDGLVVFVRLLVHPSGVDTNYVSVIALY